MICGTAATSQVARVTEADLSDQPTVRREPVSLPAAAKAIKRAVSRNRRAFSWASRAAAKASTR